MGTGRPWLRNTVYLAIGIALLLSAGLHSHHHTFAQAGDVSIHLHLSKTTVEVGEEIQATLSIANSIAEPPIKVRLILKVPPGMSVSSTEHLEAGAGQYIGTYDVDTGKLRHIGLVLHPNQAGFFVVEGHLEWYFGDDTGASETKTQSFPVTVRSPVVTAGSSRSPTGAAIPSWLWPIIITALILLLIVAVASIVRARIIPAVVTVALVVVIGLFVWQSMPGSTTSEFSASVSPLGTGMVSPSSGSYATGTVVSLVATPVSGYRFLNWTGNAETVADTRAASTSIRLNQDVFIIANFMKTDESTPPPQPAVQHTLTISSTPGGSVTTPGEGTFRHEAGTVVSLVATPVRGYQFVNWTGNVGSILAVRAASTSIRLEDDCFITANFVKTDESTPPPQPAVRHTLRISSSSGGSVTMPGEGVFEYDAGTVVTLVATPTSCYEFAKWTGEVGTVANIEAASTSIRLDRNYSISASFVDGGGPGPEPPISSQYDINICSTPGGSVTTPGEGTFRYRAGTLVSLMAIPASGYEFADWTGDVGAIADVYAPSTSITLNQDCSVSANFVKVCEPKPPPPPPSARYDLSISSTYGGLVTTPGEGTFTYDAGAVVNLVAEAEVGWRFVEWRGDPGTIVDDSASITSIVVYGAYSITASFQKEEDRALIFTDNELESAIREAINKLEGDLCLSELGGLTELQASGRGIVDLTGLEHLTGLTSLYLGNNHIRDISPIASLNSLTYLSLHTNQIEDISPLASLTKLEGLYIRHNQIGDISPLVSLSDLTQLNLWHNQIGDIRPLANLTKLRHLILSQNQVRDVSHLANLTDLSELCLCYNQISDISHLQGLTSLTMLNLGGNQIGAISVLTKLVNLNVLYLWGNHITDVSSLAHLANLQMLSLRFNLIEDISPLVDNSGLGRGDRLDLTGNPLSSDSVNIHIPQLEARGVIVSY